MKQEGFLLIIFNINKGVFYIKVSHETKKDTKKIIKITQKFLFIETWHLASSFLLLE